MDFPTKLITAADGKTSFYAVDLGQKTDVWLEWRKLGISASDIPVVLGLSPYKTPYQLWAEKTGRYNTVDISANPNVRRGNRLEDTIRMSAEQQSGHLLVPVCGEYTAWRPLRASFDGVDILNRPHEFKAPSDKQYEDVMANGVASAAYIIYEAQTQAQAIVANQTEGFLYFYRETQAGPEGMMFEITLTVERRDEIITAAKQFWHYVETDTPPPKDPERDLYEPLGSTAVFNWSSSADIWRNNNARMKSLKEELAVIENDQKAIQKSLLEQMGEYDHADIAGVKVAKFEKQGAIDYKAFLEDRFPGQDLDQELDTYRKPSRSEARFTRSEDELINRTPDEIITGRSSYF